MQPTQHVPFAQSMILVGTTSLSFEVVQSFVIVAEEARLKNPIVLYTLLQAERNRESIRTHDYVVPKDHVWMTSSYDEAVALLLAPIFYRMKIGEGLAEGGVALPREDALDNLRFDAATHREMLRLVLDGVR